MRWCTLIVFRGVMLCSRLDAPWVQYGGPWHGASPEHLAQLSPWSRSAIGWPMPGNRYWTEKNIAAVAKRYPGIDMHPYRRGSVRPAL